MANSKISALTDGNPAQSGDEIPIARSGANYKITAGSIASLGGDVDGPASSVDNQIALFDSTTGKLIKAATTTGVLKASSGVIAAATSGTDYAPATTGTSILKGSGTGGFSNAAAGTDYAAATTGTNAQLLANNGSGGFSNVTVGSGLTLAAGTLSASGGGSGDVVGPASSTDNAIARFDSTTGKLIQNSGVTIDDSNNLTLPGQADLRFADSDSSNWVAFQSPATVAANITWTLPSVDGSTGQALVTNGTGTLSWATPGGSPGGSTTQVQYNSSGSFAGSSNMTFDGTNLSLNSTGAVKIPSGTTAQRPTASTGMMRLNTTTGYPEYYDGSNWALFGVYSTQRAIFGYGLVGVSGTAITNLVSNAGVVASDTAGVGTARTQLAATSYGSDKAMFGYGAIVGGSLTAVTNLVSNTGVVASDTTGVGTARSALAAAKYSTDKAIFGYGKDASVNVSVTNLVSNTGVVATDTTGVGTARRNLAAASYGSDKAIFGYGSNFAETVGYSMTNLVSNTGVVATDTTGVGTQRFLLAAAGYGGDKAIFGYGYTGSANSVTNLVSNTGVVATDTTGVGTARWALGAAGYGGDKAIFGFGFTGSAQTAVTNLVSNTGVVATDTTGVGTARRDITAASFG